MVFSSNVCVRSINTEFGPSTWAVESGAVESGAVSEGAVSEGAVSEGAVSEGAVSEGAVSEGAVSEGAVSEGAVSEGAVSEGAVSEGAVSEGAVSEGAVSEGVGEASQPIKAMATLTSDKQRLKSETEETGIDIQSRERSTTRSSAIDVVLIRWNMIHASGQGSKRSGWSLVGSTILTASLPANKSSIRCPTTSARHPRASAGSSSDCVSPKR